MYRRFNGLSPAILFASCLWITDSGATTVSYDHGLPPAKGLVKNSPQPVMPFAVFPTSGGERHAAWPPGLEFTQYPHLGESHPGHGYANGIPWDRDNDWQHGGTNIPHLPHSTGHCPSIPPFPPTPSAVPVPGALWLFLSGLVGLALTGNSRRR